MTIIVPAEKWEIFFRDISRQNQSWETSLEIIHENMGAQVVAKNQPLLGIATACGETRNMAIQISVGKANNGHITHKIECPEKVAMLEIDNEIGSSIAIEDKSGSITLMHIQKPALYFPWATAKNT